MYRAILILLVGLFVSTDLSAQDDATGRRVALVIGNGGYERAEDRLPNPPNDALAIVAKLKGLGFEVIEAIDLDYREMRLALRHFDRALRGADAGLFFYAGHGMEYRGRNYLFPTDAVLETEGDVGLGLIDVGQVLQVMETTVPTRLVFLDACRNNPLARRFRSSLGATRSTQVGTGLARIDAAVGTFIAYATAPGQLAEDGQGLNSPFSAAMIKHLDEPGLDVSQFMRRVRNSVIEETNERQVPWNSSSLRGSFVLNLIIETAEDKADSENSAVAIGPNAGDDTTEDREAWAFARQLATDEAFQAYIDSFCPEGRYCGFAQAALTANRRKEEGETKEKQTAETSDHDVANVKSTSIPPLPNEAELRSLLANQPRDKAVDAALAVVSIEDLDTRAGEGDSLAAAILGLALNFGKGVQQSYERAFFWLQKACAGDVLRGCNNLGVFYLDGTGAKQDIAQATSLFTRSCNGGNALACTNLGKLHMDGRGVEKDYALARTLYEKSCQAGYAGGCARLGWLYQDGLGVDQDYVKARALNEKACDGDIMQGCNNLGVLDEWGQGGPQDYAKAYALFERACNEGYALGCKNLGDLYELGKGVDQDYAKARDLFEEACNADNARGCTDLGWLYDNGKGVARDYAKARTLYEKACDGDHARGCTNLGWLYEDGLGVEKDYAKAHDLYRQGCDGDYPRGCANLGWLYEDGLGVEQDYAKARDLYRQGCDGDFARGCTNLGYLYEKGLGVGQDYARARDLYQQGCDGDHARGCNNLGVIYEQGYGVPKDYAKAYTSFEKACDQGYAPGCMNLGDLYKGGLGVAKNVATANDYYQKACADGEKRACERIVR